MSAKNGFLEAVSEERGSRGGVVETTPPPAADPLPTVRRELLGHSASVLLPVQKLKSPSPRGRPFEQEIHEFLLTSFNGYTLSSGNISGHWKDQREGDHYGEHREYRVALPDQTCREAFEVFLAGLAHEMDENCLYLGLGSEIFLIYARPV